jgi:hypothetical protein
LLVVLYGDEKWYPPEGITQGQGRGEKGSEEKT